MRRRWTNEEIAYLNRPIPKVENYSWFWIGLSTILGLGTLWLIIYTVAKIATEVQEAIMTSEFLITLRIVFGTLLIMIAFVSMKYYKERGAK